MIFFFRIGFSIGISTLQYIEGFLFLRALFSRVGFKAPRPLSRLLNSTAVAAHQVCESTIAYRKDTSSMKVEEVQSRNASVVHRNGQNMSAAQTTAAAVPGSIASFFGRYKPHLCLPVRRRSKQGPTFQPLLQHMLRGRLRLKTA